jgi:hypothetical protein
MSRIVNHNILVFNCDKSLVTGKQELCRFGIGMFVVRLLSQLAYLPGSLIDIDPFALNRAVLNAT